MGKTFNVPLERLATFKSMSKAEIAEMNEKCARLNIARHGSRAQVMHGTACTTSGNLDKHKLKKRTRRVQLDDQTTMMVNRYVSKTLSDNGSRVVRSFTPANKIKWNENKFVGKDPETGKMIRAWEVSGQKAYFSKLSRKVRGKERS